MVDPNAAKRNLIRSLLQRVHLNMHYLGGASDFREGIQLLKQSPLDIVFLSIELDTTSAFDLLSHFPRPSFQVVFIANDQQLAYRAFQFSALDYLINPVDFSQIQRVLRKWHTFGRERLNTSIPAFHRIALSSAEELVLLKIEQILRLEADGNYTSFYTYSNEKIVVSKTIKEYENILPKGIFFRVHQSHIVNTNFIVKILKEDGGYVIMEDGTRVPVSRRRKEALIKLLMHKSL